MTEKTKKPTSNYLHILFILGFLLIACLTACAFYWAHESEKNDTYTTAKPHQTIYMRKSDRLQFTEFFYPNSILRKNKKGGNLHINFDDSNHVYNYPTVQCIKKYHSFLKKPYITRKQFIKFYKQCKTASEVPHLANGDCATKLPKRLAKKIAIVDSQGFEYDAHIKRDEFDGFLEGLHFKRKLAPTVYVRNQKYLKEHNVK